MLPTETNYAFLTALTTFKAATTRLYYACLLRQQNRQPERVMGYISSPSWTQKVRHGCYCDTHAKSCDPIVTIFCDTAMGGREQEQRKEGQRHSSKCFIFIQILPRSFQVCVRALVCSKDTCCQGHILTHQKYPINYETQDSAKIVVYF